MEIVSLDQKNTDEIKDVLKIVSDKANSIDRIMIVGLYKNGDQFLETSTMSMFEKCFLAMFIQSYYLKCFQTEEAAE